MKGMFWNTERGFFEDEGISLIDWLKSIKPVSEQHKIILDSLIQDIVESQSMP